MSGSELRAPGDVLVHLNGARRALEPAGQRRGLHM